MVNTKKKKITIYLNGVKVPLKMYLGKLGECYFLNKDVCFYLYDYNCLRTQIIGKLEIKRGQLINNHFKM